MSKYTVQIHHDEECDCPCENDGSWQFYSFSSRHNRYKNPEEFLTPNLKPKLGTLNKLRVGLAFFLDYYEHGLCVWSVSGEGPQDRWDTAKFAGIAVWEENPSNMGAKTYEDRKADCRSAAEEYTNWCNGQCYGYIIVDNENNDEIVDSCFGFIGDYIAEAIQEAMPEDATPENTTVSGAAKDIADYLEIFPKRKNNAPQPAA